MIGRNGAARDKEAPRGDGGRRGRDRGRAKLAALSVVPGEVLAAADPVPLNPGREITVLRVLNTGDRPVRIGSHLHFPAANGILEFDRTAARGQRLHIPAGTVLCFEPGVAREVELVPLAGAAVVPAHTGARDGAVVVKVAACVEVPAGVGVVASVNDLAEADA